MAGFPPGLSVEFWSRTYPPEDLYEYRSAIRSPSPRGRLRDLWKWKDLDQPTINKDATLDVASKIQISETSSEHDTLKRVRNQLIKAGALKSKNSNSIILPQFLLHAIDSENGQYSTKFPILDRRVWQAYASLNETERRNPIPAGFSDTDDGNRYSRLIDHLHRTCTEGVAVATVERSYFMLGGVVAAIRREGGDRNYALQYCKDVEQMVRDYYKD